MWSRVVGEKMREGRRIELASALGRTSRVVVATVGLAAAMAVGKAATGVEVTAVGKAATGVEVTEEAAKDVAVMEEAAKVAAVTEEAATGEVVSAPLNANDKHDASHVCEF